MAVSGQGKVSWAQATTLENGTGSPCEKIVNSTQQTKVILNCLDK